MNEVIYRVIKHACISILIFCTISIFPATAQNIDCGTPSPKIPIHPDSTFARTLRTTATYPLLMKVYVHVFADDDGSNLAAGDSSVMRQMENMRNFYAAHGICFILVGYDIINSSDLNNHNTDNEATDLNNFLVSGMLNVFVHAVLVSNDGGLNGSAYAIPNYYLSISRGAVTSATNVSTLAHEMGHDFGLYHTFQSRFDGINNVTVRENVTRSGSCKNCETEGDLICDTQADRNIADLQVSSTNCTYTGTEKDDCDVSLQMTPTNIMTYGRRACRSVLTNGQGNRAEDFILTTNFLTNAIAPETIIISGSINVTSGRRNFVARNSIGVSAPISITGTAVANFASNSITIPPGVTFSPSGNGYTAVRTNVLCQ